MIYAYLVLGIGRCSRPSDYDGVANGIDFLVCGHREVRVRRYDQILMGRYVVVVVREEQDEIAALPKNTVACPRADIGTGDSICIKPSVRCLVVADEDDTFYAVGFSYVNLVGFVDSHPVF